MILELLENLLTPCSIPFRRIGYLRGQLGIKVRHRQCRTAWRSHLELTKVAILSAVKQCQQHRKCVILGSGRLLDVPLRELSKQFREVILVDTVHPPIAYLLARWYGNVRLVRADVTGTADQLPRVRKQPGLVLPTSNSTLFCDDAEIDYVASVNLMSQLGYLPGAFLENKRSEEEIDAYARSLMLAHLDYLERLPGVVTLITDYEKVVKGKDGQVMERIDILYGVSLPWDGEEWVWNHVPLNLISSEFGYERVVRAISNVKAQARRVAAA